MADVDTQAAETGLAALAASLLDAPFALIAAMPHATVDPGHAHGFHRHQIDEAVRICLHLRAGPGDVVCERLDQSLTQHRLVAGPPFLRSCIAVTWPGVLVAVFDTEIRAAPDPARLAQLRHIARLAAGQAGLARKNAELERLHAQALRASFMLRSAMEAQNISAALTRLVAELCRHHGATVGRIWKLAVPEGTLREISRFEDDNLAHNSYYRTSAQAPLSTRNSFTARAIEANEPRFMLYSQIEHPEYFGILEDAIASGLKCQVSFPIWVEHERFGIAMSFPTERHDLPDVIADIEALADTIRPALYRKVTEERLQLLGLALDATNDAMLITEAEPLDEPGPRILYANSSFYRMTGYLPAEVLGRSPRFMQGPLTDRAVTQQIGQRLRVGQTARGELENYRRDGSRLWVELEITPIADANGRTTHLVSVQRDVTMRRDEQQIALQSEKLRTIGQLTGGVAHDFNNLLTVVTLNLDMALSDMAPGDALQELLQPAMRAATRGIDLTQQLLSYARRSWLRPEPLPISALFDTLQPLLTRTLSALYTLDFQTEQTHVSAIVDHGQLDNALLNLVINARDAMPAGGTIRLSAAVATLATTADGLRDEMAPGRYVRIRVQDEGSGIPADVISRVFDPFFTTKDVGKGTGLGLSMVYGFAKQTGGTASISSQPGRGTTVTLYLPAQF